MKEKGLKEICRIYVNQDMKRLHDTNSFHEYQLNLLQMLSTELIICFFLIVEIDIITNFIGNNTDTSNLKILKINIGGIFKLM